MAWQGISTLVGMALLVTACGQNLGDAPEPTGSYRALNGDKWNWRENHLLTTQQRAPVPSPAYRPAATASAGAPGP